MREEILWYVKKQVDRTLESLEKNNMKGFFIEDEQALTALLAELLPEGAKVGVGDSMTLFETGVIDFLRKGNYNFLDKYRESITKEEKKQLYLENFSADAFLCSTNALTEAGELYNIDGNGSRVAPMIYGPKQVIVVAGVNKLVKDLEAAEKRVRNYAAPMDAKRLGKDTPCAVLGSCVDCKSPQRICNTFSVIRRQFEKDRIKVILLGKSLGY